MGPIGQVIVGSALVQRNPLDRLGIRLYVPLLGGLALVVLTALAGVPTILRRQLHEEAELRTAECRRVLDSVLEEQGKQLAGLIEFLESDESLREAFLARDRERLYRSALPAYDGVLSGYDVTHYYFVEPDGTCFLRVHSRDHNGDFLDRVTMDQARSGGETAIGYEVGQHGTLTLRVVRPWRIDGELVGYLELGREFFTLLPMVAGHLESEMVAFLDTQFLSAEARQSSALRRIGGGEFAIIGTTIDAKLPVYESLFASRDDNETSWLSINDLDYVATAQPLIDAQGRTVGSLGIYRDVTDSLSAHAEINQLLLFATLLLAGVGAVLLVLFVGRIQKYLRGVFADLEAARVASDHANSAKSDFLANMSHEIRTPMTAILGYSEELAEPGLDPDDREQYVDTIRRNGEHLLQIVNDILDLSKIEAGGMSITREPFSLREAVESVEDLMSVRAEEKGLELSTDYEGEIPDTVESSPLRFRQILINLIGNAVKFTESGEIRVRTRIDESGSKPAIEVDVVDSGRGMTESEVEKLFVPFTQGDESMSREFGGTGLGLTISQRFADMLGGSLQVIASEPGVGTTMRLRIDAGNMAFDDASSSHDAAAEAPSETSTVQTVDGLRVLLAEDARDNRVLITALLEKAGVEVTSVEDGKAALEAAVERAEAGNAFDVILMDMQMPIMDGYQATSELRARGYTGPIIALTAHSMVGDRERCLDVGCDDYLTKPIHKHQLIDFVYRHTAGVSSL